MADDKKRRVVRGPQDVRPQDRVEQPKLSDYSQVVSDSSRGALQDMNDQNYQGQISALDQYPKLKRSEDNKVIIQESPVTGKQPTRSSIDDVYTKNDQVGGGGAPEDWRHKRGDEISSLMDKYTKANEQKSRRQRQIGGQATSIAFSNPAAAAVYERGYKNYIDEPTSSIDDGQKSVVQRQGIDKSQSTQQSTDDDMDSQSQVSKLARSEFQALTGRPAPRNATAADIKKVLPQSTSAVKRDTAVYNTNTVATTKDEDRTSRQDVAGKGRQLKKSQGNLNRANQNDIAKGHDKAGIGRTIITGTMAQDKANQAGTSSQAQSTANAATIPHAYQGGKYLVTKPGIPPDKTRADKVALTGGQSRKYSFALNKAIDILKSNNGRPDWFDKNWLLIKQAMADAVQANVKANGNGVANGPDIVQAQKSIGSPTDLSAFIKNGLVQLLTSAAQNTPKKYDEFADSMGYALSDTPSQTSKNLGTGGSQSSRQPVNPATGAAANQAASQYGFPAVTNPSGTPDIPAQVPLDKKQKAADALRKMGF